MLPSQAARSINLNRPAVVATFMLYFINKDWKPEMDTKPYVVEDAWRLLTMLYLPEGA